MSGLINFDTTCPWQLCESLKGISVEMILLLLLITQYSHYVPDLFSFVHILGGLCMFLLDLCNLFAGVTCIESEILMQRMMALSFIYVGGLYAMLTYHNKDKPPKITRLSNMALNAATAMLVSVVFIGNAKYGGFERSWMHMGDMWTVRFIHRSYIHL